MTWITQMKLNAPFTGLLAICAFTSIFLLTVFHLEECDFEGLLARPGQFCICLIVLLLLLFFLKVVNGESA